VAQPEITDKDGKLLFVPYCTDVNKLNYSAGIKISKSSW